MWKTWIILGGDTTDDNYSTFTDVKMDARKSMSKKSREEKLKGRSASFDPHRVSGNLIKENPNQVQVLYQYLRLKMMLKINIFFSSYQGKLSQFKYLNRTLMDRIPLKILRNLPMCS